MKYKDILFKLGSVEKKSVAISCSCDLARFVLACSRLSRVFVWVQFSPRRLRCACMLQASLGLAAGVMVLRSGPSENDFPLERALLHASALRDIPLRERERVRGKIFRGPQAATNTNMPSRYSIFVGFPLMPNACMYGSDSC
jgi:hypothetical protein